MLNFEVEYRFLSGVAHGQGWALMQAGYTIPETLPRARGQFSDRQADQTGVHLLRGPARFSGDYAGGLVRGHHVRAGPEAILRDRGQLLPAVRRGAEGRSLLASAVVDPGGNRCRFRGKSVSFHDSPGSPPGFPGDGIEGPAYGP